MVSTTANCMRGLFSYPRSRFSCGISPAAWIVFAATRRAPRSATEQLQALASEMEESGSREAIFSEWEAQLERTRQRLDAIVRQRVDLPVKIGRKGLPTTLAGLLIHAAEHTQRHVGQAITTAKVIVAQRI